MLRRAEKSGVCEVEEWEVGKLSRRCLGEEKENHARSHKKEKSVKSDDERAGWTGVRQAIKPARAGGRSNR